MEKLKSMTAFVLEQGKLFKEDGSPQRMVICDNHAKFLSQTLNISMFIPAKLVDGEWVVLEEPIETIGGVERYTIEYEAAESNILFEGFEIITDEKNRQYFTHEGQSVFIDKCWALRHETVEDLVKYKPTLTITAKKQIGL